MKEKLEALNKALKEMPDNDLEALLKRCTLTEGEDKQYAPLEHAVTGCKGCCVCLRYK